MKRREFLKLLGVTVAALKFAPLTIHNGFDPNKCYYDYVTITDVIRGEDDPVLKYCRKLQQEQIDLFIPKRHQHKVTWFYFDFSRDTSGNPLLQKNQSWWAYNLPENIDLRKLEYCKVLT